MTDQPFVQLSKENAALRRRIEELEKQLEKRGSQQRQLDRWGQMWNQLGSGRYASATRVAQSGLYAGLHVEGATTEDVERDRESAILAIDDVVKAGKPLLGICGRLGKPF